MIDDLIKRAVQKHLPAGYDCRLFRAQLWQESRFDPVAVSRAGARGIAQIMPKTWATWSIKAGHEDADPFSIEAGIDTGACYLGWLVNQWFADRPELDRYCLAMASYNAGLGNILAAQRAAGGANDYASIITALVDVTSAASCWETTAYTRRILGYYTGFVVNGTD